MKQDCTPGRYSNGKGTVNLFPFFCFVLFYFILFFFWLHNTGPFSFLFFSLAVHIYFLQCFHSPLLYITPLSLNAFFIYNMFNCGFCPFLLDFNLVFLPAGFPCKLCPPGSFNNETRAQTCECCPDGFSSTYMKTSCRPCPANEWAKHENFPNCSLCQTCFRQEDCEYLC